MRDDGIYARSIPLVFPPIKMIASPKDVRRPLFKKPQSSEYDRVPNTSLQIGTVSAVKLSSNSSTTRIDKPSYLHINDLHSEVHLPHYRYPHTQLPRCIYRRIFEHVICNGWKCSATLQGEAVHKNRFSQPVTQLRIVWDKNTEKNIENMVHALRDH